MPQVYGYRYTYSQVTGFFSGASSSWILAIGSWNDAGLWDDSATWNG